MICTIGGCTKPVFIKKRGWCNMHYQRWRNGSDMQKPPKRSGGTRDTYQDRFGGPE